MVLSSQLPGERSDRGLHPAISDALLSTVIDNLGRAQGERYTSARWSMRTTLMTLASTSIP